MHKYLCLRCWLSGMFHQSLNVTNVQFVDRSAHLWPILPVLKSILPQKCDQGSISFSNWITFKSTYVDVRLMWPSLWLHLCTFSSQDSMKYAVSPWHGMDHDVVLLLERALASNAPLPIRLFMIYTQTAVAHRLRQQRGCYVEPQLGNNLLPFSTGFMIHRLHTSTRKTQEI